MRTGGSHALLNISFQGIWNARNWTLCEMLYTFERYNRHYVHPGFAYMSEQVGLGSVIRLANLAPTTE